MKILRNFCLLTGFLLVFTLCFSFDVMGQFFFMENPLVGEQAPEFALATTERGEVTLTDARDGKKTIVFFWATWCPHCRVQLKELSQNKKAIAEKNIEIIPVDTGESKEVVLAYAKKNGLDFEIFLDQETSIAEKYSVLGVPSFYFIDESGVVQAVEHALPEDYEAQFVSKVE